MHDRRINYETVLTDLEARKSQAELTVYRIETAIEAIRMIMAEERGRAVLGTAVLGTEMPPPVSHLRWDIKTASGDAVQVREEEQ